MRLILSSRNPAQLQCHVGSAKSCRNALSVCGVAKPKGSTVQEVHTSAHLLCVRSKGVLVALAGACRPYAHCSTAMAKMSWAALRSKCTYAYMDRDGSFAVNINNRTCALKAPHAWLTAAWRSLWPFPCAQEVAYSGKWLASAWDQANLHGQSLSCKVMITATSASPLLHEHLWRELALESGTIASAQTGPTSQATWWTLALNGPVAEFDSARLSRHIMMNDNAGLYSPIAGAAVALQVLLTFCH